MSTTVPTLVDEPFYTIRCRLDGQDYTLEFRYSDRQSRYYLTLYDANDAPLVCGLKLVSNIMLLRYYHYRDGMPPGELMVTCATTDASSPTFGELAEGGRCQLTYFTQAEVLAQAAVSKAARDAGT